MPRKDIIAGSQDASGAGAGRFRAFRHHAAGLDPARTGSPPRPDGSTATLFLDCEV
jgi:hypothetical protein